MERLSKVLAQAGVASRRKAEELITSGKVKVNGEIVDVLGSKVGLKDVVLVDDKPIEKAPLFYYLLNKPSGYLSSVTADHQGKTILELFDNLPSQFRVYPVAKLEFDMAGAMIVTNDGELTKKLTKSHAGIQKEYNLRLEGIVIKDKIRQAKNGIQLEDGYVFKPVDIAIAELDKRYQTTLIKIVIVDETNKQLRELFKALGHKVKSVTRIRYDFLTLEGVERGTYRSLRAHEIKRLHREIS